MQGASIFHLARGPAPAQVLHHPRHPRARPGSRRTSGSSASRTPSTSPRPAPRRWPSSRATRSTELEELGEEIFDEAMAHRIWPGTRALAQMHLDQGQRVWLVTAAPIEIATIIARRLGLTGALGTVVRARRRRLHRPAGRRDAARPGQGGGGQGARRARGPRPGPLLGVLRLLQRPADARPWSATRASSTPTPGCATTPGQQGWRVRDYRTGRKAARAGLLARRPRRAPPPARCAAAVGDPPQRVR